MLGTYAFELEEGRSESDSIISSNSSPVLKVILVVS